jgi:16S rRNA processing protein RimM
VTEPPEPLLDVGRIVKPHGLDGGVIVAFESDRPERTEVGASFVTDRGELVIGRISRHQQRWIVHFEGIPDRDAADTWRGTVLRAAPLDATDGVRWVHELIGCRVVETSGRDRGVVEAVESNPASDLLVLDTGALVPLTFVVGQPVEGRIEVEVPDGLFELYGG